MMAADQDTAADHVDVGDGPGGRLLYRFARRLVLLIAFPYFRVKVRGREWLSIDGPTIVAPVHRSNLDTPIIGSASHRRVRSLAKHTLFKGRFWTWFISALGGFPVERGAADRRAMATARMLLDRGEPVLVFPEGTRQSGDVVQPLFEGAAYLAEKTGAMTVPVGAYGTEQAMPPGRKFPKRSLVRIVVGEPIPAPRVVEGVGRRSRRDAFNAELYERLQELYDEAKAWALE